MSKDTDNTVSKIAMAIVVAIVALSFFTHFDWPKFNKPVEHEFLSPVTVISTVRTTHRGRLLLIEEIEVGGINCITSYIGSATDRLKIDPQTISSSTCKRIEDVK